MRCSPSAAEEEGEMDKRVGVAPEAEERISNGRKVKPFRASSSSLQRLLSADPCSPDRTETGTPPGSTSLR